ncbi:glycosyltransferase family 4 protein [Flavihumibacter rivuli]|uniref:glycosyltransferase family 4 protein n=1 Tax=Flavihumibacter rivuli TaxID=2838156 RepID=UPI001BDE9D8A|nr:glycosyltransferase family 4 protein [Flavihumibacter rivuli]ULQ56254.1 glycosyltransferase family 4 protein [Flavihumibacter rivuli]
MKKVLIITPTPTHPDTAGNRKMVKYLASFFKERGYEVHCLYLAFEQYDKAAMKAFFNGHLFEIAKDDLYRTSFNLHQLSLRLRLKWFRVAVRLKKWLGLIGQDDFLYNSHLDQHIGINALDAARKLIDPKAYDIVVCEYVWMSSLLSLFGSKTFKIIDTHDKFSDRYKVFQELGKKPEWISLYPGEEKRGLKRADLILALNENERNYFSHLTGHKTILFGCLPGYSPLPRKSFEKHLLYIASANELNLLSINWFIKEVFPLVQESDPMVKLIIGGRISSKVHSDNPSIEMIGEIESALDFYKSGDIVINPELGGTGLKIKTLEALSIGMPIVATTSGAAGVMQPNKDHILIGNTSVDLAGCIIRLLKDERLRVQVSENAIQWFKDYKLSIEKGLLDAVGVV